MPGASGSLALQRDDVLYLALPFVVAFLLGFAFFTVYRRRRSGGSRPWWGSPLLWLATCAVFICLGVFVWPGLFGGVLLFLPFVWIHRSSGDESDPRTNGHARSNGHRV